jgi:hypothetical protein
VSPKKRLEVTQPLTVGEANSRRIVIDAQLYRGIHQLSLIQLDELFPDGGRDYWKSHFLDELTDELIDTVVELDSHRPTPESVVFIRTLGGAISRVADDATAYPHRSAAFNLSVDASWRDPALDDTAIGWARSTWDALAEFGTGGVYLNFAGLGEESATRAAALGRNAARLDAIRRAYDPDGLFEAAAFRP